MCVSIRVVEAGSRSAAQAGFTLTAILFLFNYYSSELVWSGLTFLPDSISVDMCLPKCIHPPEAKVWARNSS